MAMFGASAAKSAAKYDPSQLSPQDKLMLFGATLRDVGSSLSGGEAKALLQTQSVMAARQQEAQKQAFLGGLEAMLKPQYSTGPAPTVSRPGLIGGQASASMADPSSAIASATGAMAPQPAADAPASYRYQPPQRTSDGLNINSPELPSLLLGAPESAKGQLTMMLDAMKAQQADMAQDSAGGFYNKHNAGLAGTRTANRANVANTIVDLNDPENTNRVVPEAPTKGAMPVYDNHGRVTDWTMPRGALDALGAVSQANQRGQTMGSVFNRPNGDGSTTPTIGSDMFGGGAGPPGGFGGGAGGAGRTQTPADAEAAKIEAAARAQAKVDLPKLTQTSNQAISLIDGMLNHPSLKARTGMSGLLPAFPGTKDAGFDAMAKQIHGKTFLEAFNSLKGAGQITEIEGAKATDAIARLDRAQSAEDYIAALTDLRSVVVTGIDRAKLQAAPARPAAGPTMQGKGFKILSVE